MDRSSIYVRRATVEDIDVLARLRVALQREMGHLAADTPEDAFVEATRRYLAEALPSGAFIAWMAVADGQVVASSGLIFIARPPSARNLSGREAHILNMYTVPEWRGRGIATRLLRELIGAARDADAHRIWLHASADGQPIYEKAGFAATHRTSPEMDLFW